MSTRFAYPVDVRLARVILLGATATFAVSCAAPPPKAQSDAQHNRLQLSSELLDVVDAFSSRLEQAYTRLAFASGPPRQLAILALVRNEATANARAMVLGDDPGRNLVDLYVWSRVAAEACRKRAAIRPDAFCDICESTYAVLVTRTDELARKWLPAEQIARIDTAVSTFLTGHPDLATAGLFRLIDLEDRTGIDLGADQPEDDTMFASVTEASRQLEATRITAQQMVWLVSRLPTAAGWEAQAQIDMALTGDQVKAAQKSLDDLVQRMEEAGRRLDALSSSVGSLGEATGDLDADLGGGNSVESLVRRTLLLLGGVLLVVVAAATAGALLVVRRWREPRKPTSART